MKIRNLACHGSGLALALLILSGSLDAHAGQPIQFYDREGDLEEVFGVDPESTDSESFAEPYEASCSDNDEGVDTGYSSSFTNEGGCYEGCDCCSCQTISSCAPSTNSAYVELQANFLRAHITETPGRKLAEQYEIAPRFIVGAESERGIGARASFFHYGHNQNNISDPADGGIRFDLDVLDFEGTKRLCGSWTEVVLSGGGRLAKFEFQERGATSSADLIGLTVGAAAESLICCDCSTYWSCVYGGRLSILGGDFDNTVGPPIRDENFVVTELHMGVEYGCRTGGQEWFARLAMETQNWHLEAFNTDSVGFIGPGFHFGATF